MRIPTGAPRSRLRSIVRLKVSTYSIDRPDDAVGALGESSVSNTTVSADLWLFSANEIPLDTDFGERLTGQLRGLALPTADVAVGDRLTYNGDRYRVSEVLDSQDQVLTYIGLERAVND